MAATPDISSDRLHIRDLAPGLGGIARIVGVVALLAALLLSFKTGQESFFRGYLTGFLFWLSICLGALFFVLVQHATKAGWSVTVRRIAENLAMGFGWLGVLALVFVLPIVFGFEAMHDVFPWTKPGLVDPNSAHYDAIIAGKSAYLNVPFFVIRMVAYFAIWILISNFFYNRSTRQDQSGDPKLTLEMQARSYPALVLYAFTQTFLAFDLLMSLAPHWYSTMFGVYYFAGSTVGFFSVLAITMVWLQSAGRMERSITNEHYHDVGKWIFAFVVFWAYIAFSQYMLIWYANLPEETSYYIIRQQGPWLRLSLLLLFGHFFIPFLGLISRIPKRGRQTLLIGAVWVVVMHWCDILWLVQPHIVDHTSLVPAPFGLFDMLQSLLCTAGVGGIYVWAVLRRMSEHALVPQRDPRLGESLAFENF